MASGAALQLFLILTVGLFVGAPSLVQARSRALLQSGDGVIADQRVCGTGDAQYFPTRCWYNNDPQGRYVCCDDQGCDGFNDDNFTPHCTNAGFAPDLGYSPSLPSEPPSGDDQGVCGGGDAQYFPNRCWYNNDPQGRYVCCDDEGCNGFNDDNFTPNCRNAGYIPASP